MLFHPDRAKFEDATCIFLHPSSTFCFDLNDPSRTLTAPKPLHPSLSGFLFPTEIAFLDSIVDLLFEPPAPPLVACPFLRWFSKLFEYTFCEYPNELEAEFEENDDDDDDDWQWEFPLL